MSLEMPPSKNKNVVDIAARTGGWLRAPEGSIITIIDVEGSQIADMYVKKQREGRSGHVTLGCSLRLALGSKLTYVNLITGTKVRCQCQRFL